MAQREIEALPESECWEQLSGQSVGRFVFSDEKGPGAIPVNYAVADKRVVFRVSRASHLRDVLNSSVAFEVADLHPDEGTGWSVLARGRAIEVPVGDVPGLVKSMPRIPRPVAEGVHNVWIALAVEEVTGRRLGEPFVSAL